MIYQRKVDHPWMYNVKILEYVCSNCGKVHQHRPNDNKCKSCKR